jgi:hypothetical protein
MFGRRSLNLELTPLDPNLERNIRRAHRAHVETEDIPRMQIKRSKRSTKMQELGTTSKDEHMTWISLRHSVNYSH